MKAAIFRGKGKIVIEERPKPTIKESTDSIVPELLEAVFKGTINPGKVFDLKTDLDHIAEAYAAMDERQAIKSLVNVSEL